MFLGEHTDYPQHYTPEVLFPVPRAQQREQLGLADGLPFRGADLWRGYELSWLDMRGRPRCAQALFVVPCESAALIESKSFKLYLNSLNQHRFESEQALLSVLQHDLSTAAGAALEIRLLPPDSGTSVAAPWPALQLLDSLDISCDIYQPDPALLKRRNDAEVVEEALGTALFRSLCPVTAQPDWGSLYLRYRGPAMDHAALLRYVVSYRQHQGFHEDCVERIFCDLMQHCEPQWLVLGVQFLRRGGLEINPWRWSVGAPVSAATQLLMRTGRQ